jgi:hypothetical protein
MEVAELKSGGHSFWPRFLGLRGRAIFVDFEPKNFSAVSLYFIAPLQ